LSPLVPQMIEQFSHYFASVQQQILESTWSASAAMASFTALQSGIRSNSKKSNQLRQALNHETGQLD